MKGPDLYEPYVGRLISSVTFEADRTILHFLDGTVLAFEDFGSGDDADKQVSEDLQNEALTDVVSTENEKGRKVVIKTTRGKRLVLTSDKPRPDDNDPDVHPI